MGKGREDATRLTARREWPLLVRRARPDDKAAVLEFASETWHGWDYIPRAWPVWLAADDGVLLVASRPGDDRPIAVSRVAVLSPTETWLEGIRVDPNVRGMDVATDMQVAELAWAAAQDATVVRYATGSRNEASHRLGARHGFELSAEFRAWWHTEDPDAEDRNAASAFDPEVRAAATAKRGQLLAGFAADGWLAKPTDAPGLWPRLAADATFKAGGRLYESRPWAIQELSERAFADHAARGEVVVNGEPGRAADGDWAIAILSADQLPSEDSSLRLGLLAGTARGAVELLEKGREIGGESLRVRIPHPAPMLADATDVLERAGYRSPEWALHVLARPLNADNAVPAIDPTSLLLVDPPEALGRRF